MNGPEKSSAEERSLLEKIFPWGILSISFLASFMAYSQKQREAILERDKRKCNYPLPHDCGGELCVHQIIPPRYAKAVDVDPDFPENGLTICTNIQAGPNGIFPDLAQARAEYPLNQDSFREAAALRSKKLAQKQIYWNDEHDREMSVTAVRNTQRAKKSGWEWPLKRSRKKKTE